MRYNKKQQPFTIMGRFHVLEESGETVEYCRIKFHATNKTQVVRNGLVKEGDFEDESLVSDTKNIVEETVSKSEATATEIVELINNSEDKTSINAEQIDIAGAVIASDSLDEKVETEESQEVAELPVIESSKFKAINPNGDEIEVNLSSLNEFCEENGLDAESVELCLNGAQKTHKKWKFEL